MKRREGVIIGLMWLVSSTLYLIANLNGLGLTYDSNLYIEIANQITAFGILNADGLNIKPPIFPMIISWVGVGFLPFLNYLALELNLLLVYLIGKKLNVNWIRLSFLSLMAFFTPIYLVHSFIWTEPYFTILILTSFYLFLLNENSKKPFWLAIAILLITILPFVRFAGIFVLIPFVIITLIRSSNKQRLYLVVGLFILGLAMGAWVFSFSSGFSARLSQWISVLPDRDHTVYLYNIRSFLEALSLLVIPLNAPSFARLLIGFIIIGAVCYASLYFFSSPKERTITHSFPVVFLIYYLLIHTVFKIEFYTAERYLTPLYPILIFCFFSYLNERESKLSLFKKRALMVFVSIVLLYGTSRTIKNVFFWNEVRAEQNNFKTLSPNKSAFLSLRKF
ncbi:MAG: hypothetical protein JXR03_15815 [Cyclobacteriaceae bacterium]